MNQIIIEEKTLDEIRKVQSVLQELSEIFMIGLGKLTKKEKEIFDKVNEGFSHTPLSEVLANSFSKLKNSDFSEDVITPLVYAILSLQGAIYDALFTTVGEERTFTEIGKVEYYDFSQEKAVLMENIRKWLISLLISGFKDLQLDNIDSFSSVLETISSYPELTRLNVLLRGLICDFKFTQNKKELKKYAIRFLDLWTKSYFLTLKEIKTKNKRIENAKFYPIAYQHFIHEQFFIGIIRGIVQTKDNSLFVNLEFPSFVSPLIPSKEFYSLIYKNNEELFTALKQSKVVIIEEASLSPQGVMHIEKFTVSDKSFNIKEVYENTNNFKDIYLIKKPPLDRHHVHYFLPFFIEENLPKLSTTEDTKIKFRNNKFKKNSKHFKKPKFVELRYDNDFYWNIIQFYLPKFPEEILYFETKDIKIKTETYELMKEKSSKILRK